MVVGISLGVAVAVAIDLANVSASRALNISAEAISGKATHQILHNPSSLNQGIYRQLQLDLPQISMAPRMSGVVKVLQFGGQPVNLLGIDPIAEAPFRNYLVLESGLNSVGIGKFLTQPGSAVLGQDMADRYDLDLGDRLEIDFEGYVDQLQVIGIISPADDLTRQSLDGVILVDIATAQELFNKLDKLDQIDLILPEDRPEILTEIQSFLPVGATIEEVAARSTGLNQLTAAFQLNLTALSLLAMMVGMFLIFNTMTFSVIQRRPLYGTLRSLGVTRREIFSVVLFEALVIGIIGSMIGVAVGILLGKATIGMVSQTVNDLYFTTTVRDVGLPLESLIKGVILGILASVLTAIPPAWEASSVPASEALSRISIENKTKQFVQRTSIGGVAAFLAGWGILSIPSRSLYSGFGGLLLVVLGFALVTALLMVGLMRAANPITELIAGLIGKLAPRNLINTLSRTSIAVSALMVALSVSIGVNLMIDSFRFTVNTWLNATLTGDIYITAPNFKSNQPTAPIDPNVFGFLEKLSGIAKMNYLKIGYVSSPDGQLEISATENPNLPKERLYKHRWQPVDNLWASMQAGGVMITEPLAFQLGIDSPGQYIVIETNQGVRDFEVLAVYYDYASTSGTVQMTLDQYRKYWDDDGISAISVLVEPNTNTRTLADKIRSGLPTTQILSVRSNQELRNDVMVVFERTFAITRALQILATLVAFIGILNSLSLLQFEKQREMGIIRALGFTPRQLWGLVMMETGLMGFVSGLVAIPAGYTLALILIEVINRRSFGWSLQLSMTWQPFLQAMMVAVSAAILAGLIPARRLSRMQTIEAIRYE